MLATIMISTIDLHQNFVFAQNATLITPASQLFGNIVDDLQQDALSSDDSDEQNTPLSGVEDETENTEQTIPLSEKITNNVNEALSSNGLG